MAQIQAAKRALRKDMKRILSALSQSEKDRQSEIISTKLLMRPEYLASRRVAVYLNLPDEVRTRAIIQDVLASRRLCFVPRFDPNSDHMDMVRVHSLEQIDELPTTKYNVKQPADSEICEDALATGGLDLVVVPGLAFTADGQRLGRGKGYYDTFLARCPAAALTVALAFRQQLVPRLPTEQHDVRLHLVLHPDLS